MVGNILIYTSILLKEILDGNHLNEVFANTWEIDKVANGKTLFCANTCGKVSAIDAIFSNQHIKQISL